MTTTEKKGNMSQLSVERPAAVLAIPESACKSVTFRIELNQNTLIITCTKNKACVTETGRPFENNTDYKC